MTTMRRFGLLALGSLGLFACASLLGDFDVVPAEATAGGDGGTSIDDGSSMADASTEDAPRDGSSLLPPRPVPEVVAANQIATCATAVQEPGTPYERRATFCWGAHEKAQFLLGAMPGDLMPNGFARPRMNKSDVEYLTFDQLYGAGAWFFGRARAGNGIGFAWGANEDGQAAVDGNPRPPFVPPTPLVVQSTSGNPHKRVAGGGAAPSHGCFFDDDRRLYCWGENANCEVRSGPKCGNGCSEPILPPGGLCRANYVVPSVEDQTSRLIGKYNAYRFYRFAGGREHSCVVRYQPEVPNSHELACWGDNSYYQAGYPDPGTHVPEPTPINFFSAGGGGGPGGGGPGMVSADTELAAGDHHSCAILQGSRLFCWGKNDLGQSDPNSREESIRPRFIERPSPFDGMIGGLALGGNSSCFIVKPSNGQPSFAACFGDLSPTQDGKRGLMGRVPNIQDVQQIAVGSRHACAIARGAGDPPTAPFALFCWGSNESRQIDPNTAQRTFVLPHRIELPPIPLPP
jgi:hypothetical protein